MVLRGSKNLVLQFYFEGEKLAVPQAMCSGIDQSDHYSFRIS
jgi:hypothetical protein